MHSNLQNIIFIIFNILKYPLTLKLLHFSYLQMILLTQLIPYTLYKYSCFLLHYIQNEYTIEDHTVQGDMDSGSDGSQ